MKSVSFLLSPLSSLAQRLRRARPGSVLIIVIVLLLLLAILGAAYISTTRSARVSSAQNVLSSDVDAVMNGVAKICEGVISDDLNDPFNNLHGNSSLPTAPASGNPVINRGLSQGEGAGTVGGAPAITPTNGAYNIGDIVTTTDHPNLFLYYFNSANGSVSAAGTPIAPTPPNANGTPSNGWQLMTGHFPVTATCTDPWIADRIPDPRGTGAPLWTSITQTIGFNSAGTMIPLSILGTPFEDPTTGTVPPVVSATTPLVGHLTANPLTPTYLQIGATGTYVPAFQYGSASPPPPPPATFVAGDADGDGVADSLLFRLPGVAVDGLTWYGAVRIIDNNSAINANSAWSRDFDTLSSGATNNIWNLFQTSVGLRELVNPSDLAADSFMAADVKSLNNFRFHALGSAQTTPYDESLTNGNWRAPTNPVAFGRGDYTFLSQSDAFYNEFIGRMANPGFASAPVANNPLAGRYQAIPLSDEASLAYKFCLVNPESTLAQVPANLMESLLPFSLSYYTPAAGAAPPKYYRSSPYGGNPATDVNTWFNDNFNYGNTAAVPRSYPVGTPPPVRPLLVTHNPVSNYVAPVYNNNDNSTGFINNYSEGKAYTSDPILPNYMLPYSGSPITHFKGVWDGGTAYQFNDLVVYPGANTGGIAWNGPSYTFICVNPAGSTGVVPATFTNPGNILQSPTPAQLANWELQPWSQNPVKTNVNTATFRELFRAFWCVMAGNPSNATPFGYTPDPVATYDDTAANPQHQFRSPLRDPNSAAPGTASELDGPATTQPTNAALGAKVNTNTNTMLLRDALAAVNTLGIRDNSQNIISKTFILKNAFVLGGSTGATLTPPPTSADVEVRVYSNSPQPVISEVFVNTDVSTGNLAGYVAIELFNPYPVPINLNNWTLAYANRQAGAAGAYPNLQLKAIGTIPAGTVIWPSGYILLENFNATGAATTPNDPNAAAARPADSGLPAAGVWTGPTVATATTQPDPRMSGAKQYQDIYIPFLEDVIQNAPNPTGQTPVLSTGGELVMLHPHRADGTLVKYTDPANTSAVGNESFDETTNIADFVPVDSYDFTGLSIIAGGTHQVWSYIRAKGNTFNAGAGVQYLFKTTFPGLYNPIAIPREAATLGLGSVMNGTSATFLSPADVPVFGQPTAGGSSLGNNFPPIQVYNVGPIQIGANFFSGHFPNAIVRPNSLNGAGGSYPTTPVHPLGGFARNGDILDIPFIGAYRIRVLNAADTALTYGPTAFLEMNSLPMDSSLAAVETGSLPVDAAENVGRFVPMSAHAPGYTGADYYAWTRNIFNYLTVQSPNNCYSPNFDPGMFTSFNYNFNPAVNPYLYAYTPQDNSPPFAPTPTASGGAIANDPTKQDTVGVEGLVNVNTASWEVLSMLPFVPSNAAADQAIAKAIVLYRDGDGTTTNPPHGPFQSIFDLNQVPGFQNGAGTFTISPSGCTASSALGLLSPADQAFGTTAPSTNNPLNGTEDYQSDCLTLTRISNLITTRSDTFTVYIEVQGWQNAGAANAQPVITRRYSFIVDRSAINADPTSRYLKTLTVPNN